MAQAEHNTPKSDYLTRLANLASGHTLPDAAHTAPVVVLRPRLPSRFEGTLETVMAQDAGNEDPGQEVAPLREPGNERVLAGGVRKTSPVPVTLEAPAAAPRFREVEATRQVASLPLAPSSRAPVRLEALPSQLQQPAASRIERTENPVQDRPSLQLAARPNVVVSHSETAVPGASPVMPRSELTERTVRSSTATEVPSARAPHSAVAGAEPSREQTAIARTTLRPAPSRLPPAQDEARPISTRQSSTAGERRASETAATEERHSAPVPPVINVTIGRIEIRAPAAPQAAPQPRPELPRPAVSLEDYLQRRADGRY